ncbi:MAG: restriction endonuclease subunit S [Enterobacter sp.]|nr:MULTISPECIES: restriction endonuclease subunit S [Enterobacter]RWS67651.1 restriction endonuclease subunit S [Enterobacter cloacae]MCB7496517.1 restriction endonuclease subunit S [Enterobacter roggenkampii]MCM7156200.1 restriction endonuclease subunit S [Enterobacter roggenkampii]MCU4025684.1 restriction endonuclease subunit S [Enterobacter roggenkampii]MDU6058151.1 restriction endonuclease subunit S [Enterobacter sp.]
MSEGKLPEGWVKSELDNILLTIIGGGTPSKAIPEYYQGDIPWMSVKDMNKHTLTDTIDHITNDAVENSSTNIIPAGTPIIATRMSLGKIVTASFDSAINQDLKALFLSSGVERNFFIHWYRSQAQLIESLGTGTTVKGIRLEVLKALSINLPPFFEQKIIAEKLDTLLAQVDSTKARLEQIPQILKRFRQAVLAAAMRGKLTEIWRAHNSFNLSLKKYYELTKGQKLKAKNISEPCEEKTWLRCNIGHIFNVKSGDGLTAKEMNDSGDIPVYGGNGITGYHDKYNTEEPTIVIGRVGYYCGSVHLTPEKTWITDNALLVDFNSELITKQFAHWLLKATNLRVDTSSSAQPVISGAKIYSIEIVIPPIEEQHEIVRRVEQLFAYADTIEKQVNSALTRVNSLTQSILAKAFRGELTAQWRAENPDLISGENSAAALLEKIKAERAASGGKKTSRKKA